MGTEDLQVALRHGHVLRLADDPARVVEGRKAVGELDEVLQVFERPPAPGAVEVAHVGRTVDRRKDEIRAADLDAPGRVAGVLREPGGGERELRHGQFARNSNPLARDFRSRLAPQRQRLRISAEVDADLFEDAHRRLMDRLLGVGTEECVGGDAVDRPHDGLDAPPRTSRGGLPDATSAPADTGRRSGGATTHG